MSSFTIKVPNNYEGEDLGVYEADYLPRLGDPFTLWHPRVCPKKGEPFCGVGTSTRWRRSTGTARRRCSGSSIARQGLSTLGRRRRRCSGPRLTHSTCSLTARTIATGACPWSGNDRIIKAMSEAQRQLRLALLFHEQRAMERKLDRDGWEPEKESTAPDGHFRVGGKTDE